MGDHLVACSMVSGVACRIFLRGLVRLSFAVRSLCRCHEGTDGAVDAWCEITLGSSSAYGRGKAGVVNERCKNHLDLLYNCFGWITLSCFCSMGHFNIAGVIELYNTGKVRKTIASLRYVINASMHVVLFDLEKPCSFNRNWN